MSNDDDTSLIEQAVAQMLRDDDSLLPDAPSVERISRLRSVVDAAGDVHLGDESAGAPATDQNRSTVSRLRWPRVLSAAAALVAVFAVGVAIGGSPPGPLRDAGAAVGLPFDSTREVATKRAVDELGDALDAATTPTPGTGVDDALLQSVADADATMVATVADLSDDERMELRPVAHQVHLRAVDLFETNGRRLPTAQDEDLAELGLVG